MPVKGQSVPSVSRTESIQTFHPFHPKHSHRPPPALFDFDTIPNSPRENSPPVPQETCLQHPRLRSIPRITQHHVACRYPLLDLHTSFFANNHTWKRRWIDLNSPPCAIIAGP